MKIFAFHLLNDYSGSPKVLMQLVKGWVNEGIETTVVTGAGRNGFLSNLTGVRYKYFTYEFASNPGFGYSDLCIVNSGFLFPCIG